ncbi:penicillin-binding protein 2 [candidate division GN15 bacterium]|nr:penicillin-binding protein 2 [candidate division GN15 bacterium]
MDRFKLSLSGRAAWATTLVGAMLLFLLGGLVKLQVVDHEELLTRSESNRLRVVPIIPRRGIVYDRDGRVIIDNRPSYTVSIVPAELIRDRTIPNLADLIPLDSAQIHGRMKRNLVSRQQPAPIKKDVPFHAIAVLEEQSLNFPGVSYQMERVRLYPDSLGAEAFTGYVGEISPEDLGDDGDGSDRLGYQPGSMIGKKGLEKQYDQLLRGREGTEYVEISASGQILGPYTDRQALEAVPGSDITLSIDMDIQKACVAALDSFCCGAVVAMDPRTGEVLAATSYPGFDANIFSSVIPESLWLEIRSDSTHPLLNRVLNGLYPPGSTTKLVTVGAALEEGLINAHTTLKPCYGGMQFGNRYFRCWEHAGHGTLDCMHALEQSCDVFMYQLGLSMGIDLLHDYYAKCGFGRPTGIDLPGESDGLNPDTKYYDQRYGKNKWTRGLVMNNSIGQGEILATPLQLAQFYCGIANNGIVYRPHLVKKITKPNGEEITVPPVVSFRLPFSKETLETLYEGIRLVVEGEKGTARAQRRKEYTLGGKTGTSQNPHGENHALFCGVAPLENPEIVVCAIVENSGDGSRYAAPVVGNVIKTYMDKKAARAEMAGLHPTDSANAGL